MAGPLRLLMASMFGTYQEKMYEMKTLAFGMHFQTITYDISF
jgi:hypothetical protein